ncbi:TerB family tellurite resistance protein [Burkholderia sp. Bp9140]|uniref:TerB family tellurite resistance protein n=1 Tax=Burkholderia sp. Bp9140 TaxID=2184572 RepID=UPI000F58AFEA|nr:TerB family tellurite resistance protein [Burkholderia sp. Bp9140]RQR56375.1 TerB family tellurite resistance protein [Burkholderia sp. Bp9140]
MRSYLPNSPQAAARIVALILTVDGHVDRREEQVIETLGVSRQLGLEADEFAQVMKALHEDLQTSHFHSTNHIDAAAVDMVTREIDSPVLRRKVLEMCFTVAIADGFLADSEAEIIRLILNSWTNLGQGDSPTQNRDILLHR